MNKIQQEIEPSILKSVYCNYRGFLIVYDVHGKKVPELSGELTYAKYQEIEKRTVKDITEFEGLEEYRCFACELKDKAAKTEDNSFVRSVGVTWETKTASPNSTISTTGVMMGLAGMMIPSNSSSVMITILGKIDIRTELNNRGTYLRNKSIPPIFRVLVLLFKSGLVLVTLLLTDHLYLARLLVI